jgi:hypothetical protein
MPTRRIHVEEADNGYIVTVSESGENNHKAHNFVFIGTGNYTDRVGEFVKTALDINALDEDSIDELQDASYKGQHPLYNDD